MQSLRERFGSFRAILLVGHSTGVFAWTLHTPASSAPTSASSTLSPAFASVQTTPQALHDLLVEQRSPSGTTLLVIETCDVVGWVHDLARSLDVDVPGPSATTSTNPRWARERLHDASNEAWPVVSGE
jgi:hypothetical protein